MKFKLKAVVAAVVFAAAAGSASAATGPTDLIFFAFDNVSSKSFSYDLGPNTFNPSTSTINPLNVTANADWSSFVAADANYLTNAQWGVFMNFDGSRIGSTVTIGGSTAASNPTSANSQANIFATAAGMTVAGATHFGTGAGADNAINSIISTSGIANMLQNSYNAGNLIGATNVAFDSVIAGGRGVPSVLTTYTPSNGNGFAFDGTNVQYNVAAVPEPETYGMLAAGLLMLGFVARRRKA